jgi:hypothetical protein
MSLMDSFLVAFRDCSSGRLESCVITIKNAAVRPLFIYFIVGIENSAPARRPVGQRAVMVFIRV